MLLRRHTGRQKKRKTSYSWEKRGVGRGGDKSFDCKKAWSSTNDPILSAEDGWERKHGCDLISSLSVFLSEVPKLN
jgi:hypothetical protein